MGKLSACAHTHVCILGGFLSLKIVKTHADKKGHNVELGEYGGLKRRSLLPVQRQLSENLLQYFLFFEVVSAWLWCVSVDMWCLNTSVQIWASQSGMSRIAFVSSQHHAQWRHIDGLKLTVMGVVSWWKSANAQIRLPLPQSGCNLTIISIMFNYHC